MKIILEESLAGVLFLLQDLLHCFNLREGTFFNLIWNLLKEHSSMGGTLENS